MTEQLQISPEKIQMYREAFKQFDRNGDGTISTKELGVVMRTLGQNPTEAELADLIAEIDQDGNGEIDFDEFLHLVSKKMKDSDIQDKSLEAFKIFDRKNKGVIHINEIKNILMNMGEKMPASEVEMLIKDLELNAQGELDYNAFLANIFSNI